ncbi:similar to Saccharomyces cerevisiae YDR391C Putative protein of unknown function, possibly involved in zinc homeostasis [Maudiozyma barnettii]|uniref:N-acetyltransferase domain-containing protein n=1 Tax=Maudiozyma barnettii TaxID=61262 RepID=A0A8H2VEJ9_9SACH|nr:uncharacterized protein KABA2_03S12562 [Kazachstania barnettii]CAB4254100.1 similar to Saccharomyces cerevisiae YDR391C Putative protein of unknown function, possibly involved in zinc homeostasis [Kazachstania barnettii]CAD1781850.1 similar to Saccharomyces cerevisiae YDR391C Putative protein of unknown function, possibly involved in zinc homeostasis [Kazachstania barnettii]
MSVSKIEDFDRACTAIQNAFREEPSYWYLACKLQDKPLDIAIGSPNTVDLLTREFFTHYHDHGAQIMQAGDYATIAIWTSPSVSVPMARTSDEAFNKIFFDTSLEIKHKVIPQGMQYYYLFMIGKDPESPVKGSVRAMFDHYTERANKENVALVLEAISEHARDVYAHFGFVNYNTFKYGVGEVNNKGQLDSNGDGHTGYLMVYLPTATST